MATAPKQKKKSPGFKSSSSTKKLRAQRSRDRIPEKKVRRVLKRNGPVAAQKYVDDGFVPMSVYRRVAASRGIVV